MAPEGTTNPRRWAELATPDGRPCWDRNTRKGRASWRDIWRPFYKVSRRGPKTSEYAKPSRVIMRESESPSEFYARLYEAHRLYMPIDPETAGSQMVIKCSFCVSSLPQKY